MLENFWQSLFTKANKAFFKWFSYHVVGKQFSIPKCHQCHLWRLRLSASSPGTYSAFQNEHALLLKWKILQTYIKRKVRQASHFPPRGPLALGDYSPLGSSARSHLPKLMSLFCASSPSRFLWTLVTVICTSLCYQLLTLGLPIALEPSWGTLYHWNTTQGRHTTGSFIPHPLFLSSNLKSTDKPKWLLPPNLKLQKTTTRNRRIPNPNNNLYYSKSICNQNTSKALRPYQVIRSICDQYSILTTIQCDRASAQLPIW